MAGGSRDCHFTLFESILTERTATIEYRFHHKDHSTRWILATYTSRRDQIADCWIVTGVSIDISERKQMEEALRKNQTLLAEAQEVAHIGNWEFDLATQKITWTEELFRLLNRNPAQQEPTYEENLKLYHPEDRDKLHQTVEQTLKTGNPYKLILRVILPNGSIRYTEGIGRVEFKAGQIIRLYGTAQDVTDRIVAEQALRKSEALFRSLSEFAPIGIFKTDIEGKNIYTNPHYQRIFGLNFQEVLGYGWLELIHPEDRKIIQRQWQQVATNNQEFLSEMRYVYPDQTIRIMRVQAVPIFAEGGEFLGHIGTAEDITESRALEQMKSEFISIVSHELRTPLASIRGSLGLMASGVLQNKPETAQKMLDIAVNDTERLVRLVNDILDLERLESHKIHLNCQWCDAQSVIQQALKILDPLAKESNIKLRDCSTSIKIWADADKIVQTLVNLLSNAIKFSPANTTVTICVEAFTDHVLFQVKDQGRGIPADKLETIFGRFQQVDASDSRQKGGTGLGLAICRSIIQQHGGSIWAESVLGEGSTFYFTLLLPNDSI